QGGQHQHRPLAGPRPRANSQREPTSLVAHMEQTHVTSPTQSRSIQLRPDPAAASWHENARPERVHREQGRRFDPVYPADLPIPRPDNLLRCRHSPTPASDNKTAPPLPVPTPPTTRSFSSRAYHQCVVTRIEAQVMHGAGHALISCQVASRPAGDYSRLSSWLWRPRCT